MMISTYRPLLTMLMLAVSLSAVFAWMPRPIDMDAEPAVWQGIVIAIVQPTVKAPMPSGQYDMIHELLVERVLYGPQYPGNRLERATIPATACNERGGNTSAHPEITMIPGKHYILILTVGPGMLIYNQTWMNMGSIDSVLEVTGENDPVIKDVQAIVTAASCMNAEEKERCLRELQMNEMDHPLIARYVLLARANLATAARRMAEATYSQILFDLDKSKYDLATLILADRLYMASMEPENHYTWPTSDSRKKLFIALNEKVKPGDPNYGYIQEVLKSFNTSPAK